MVVVEDDASTHHEPREDSLHARHHGVVPIHIHVSKGNRLIDDHCFLKQTLDQVNRLSLTIDSEFAKVCQNELIEIVSISIVLITTNA